MVYVVAGIPRTGTSMMMHALVAGGIPAHPKVDKPDLLEGSWRDCSREELEGCCVKIAGVLGEGARNQIRERKHELMIIFMHRDPHAGAQQNTGEFHRAAHYGETVHSWWTGIPRKQVIRTREVDYDRALDDPLFEMKILVDLGWPIDPKAAASAVRPEVSKNCYQKTWAHILPLCYSTYSTPPRR